MGVFNDTRLGSVSEFKASGLVGLSGGGFAEVVVGFFASEDIEKDDRGAEGHDEENEGGDTGEVVFESGFSFGHLSSMSELYTEEDGDDAQED